MAHSQECNHTHDIVSQPQPMVVNIGEVKTRGGLQTHAVAYNVAEFLSDYNSINPEWKQRLGKLVAKIDDKIKIDLNDEIHKRIVEGIDGIIKQICAELTKKGFAINRILRTGSLYAGLRVARPYEADILIDFEHSDGALSSNFDYAKAIVAVCKDISMPDWIIQSAFAHDVGVQFELIYDNGVDHVGVQFDLAPMTRHNGDLPKFTEDATRYLSSFDETIYEFRNVKLRTFPNANGDNDADTSCFEHQILKNSNDEIKRGYRVAKYLLQSELVPSKRPLSYVMQACYIGEHIIDEQAHQLYGYKPLVPNHILQVFLLQLLVKTHDTSLACQLTGSTLTLCLLDMLYTTAKTLSSQGINSKSQLVLFDALLEGKKEEFSLTSYERDVICVVRGLEMLSCSLAKHALLGNSALLSYRLINQPSAFIYLIDDHMNSHQLCAIEYSDVDKILKEHYPKLFELMFGRFCRGASLQDMADAHDCSKEKCHY